MVRGMLGLCANSEVGFCAELERGRLGLGLNQSSKDALPDDHHGTMA